MTCPWTDRDECRMAGERAVAGTDHLSTPVIEDMVDGWAGTPMTLPTAEELILASRNAALEPYPYEPGDEGPTEGSGPERDEEGTEL